MSYHCKLRHRKKGLENFRKFIFKSGILEFWYEALFVSILTYASNDKYDHNQNMILTKIVITKFHEKFMFFSEIQIIKMIIKVKETGQF